ncbi:MAG: polyamine aminopropyltransferase [Verrucomicrobiaceae bacterium]
MKEDNQEPILDRRERSTRLLLLASVFTIATCGLIYELIAGTLASYLLGDSITQFSTVIGVYLFAMGVGSWLSRYVSRSLVAVFVEIELLIGLVGGWSAALLFMMFESAASFRVLLYALVCIIGTLVGMEIPLLLRLLKDRLEFKDLVSRVLSLDYVGALLASLLFPLVLVPQLGLMRSSFLFGFLNAIVGLIALFMLRREIRRWRGLLAQAIVVLAALIAGFIFSEKLMDFSEHGYYSGENVILSKSTPYQRIVLTRHRDDLRLYLNGNLQFSSRDEYRYHESLVHPVMSRVNKSSRILILGGGDGLAMREVLRYPEVAGVTLVDLDPEMTRMFSSVPMLTALNQNSLTSSRAHIINADAFAWLETNHEIFDAVIIDFPDPTSFSLGKLYTTAFYQRLQRALSPGALIVVQTTSPLVARQSYWCVDVTLRACGFQTVPYHCYVPSFGEWGFIMASKQSIPMETHLPPGLKFFTDQVFITEQSFSPDMSLVNVEVNKLNNQALVRLFEKEWGRYLP